MMGVNPVHVVIPWMYDDGTTTRDATLSGDVYNDRSVDAMILVLDGGDEIVLRGRDRRDAEGELRAAAYALLREEGV